MASFHWYFPTTDHAIYSLELRITHLELDFISNENNTWILCLNFGGGTAQGTVTKLRDSSLSFTFRV